MRGNAGRWIVCIVTVLFACSTNWCAAGDTFHVAPDGNDANDGSGWGPGSALLTIGAGVTKAAAANNDIVLVSNGTYTVTAEISVTKAITVRGLTGLRDTIVDGDGNSRCFNVNNASAVLDGLTISNAYSTADGGGVYHTAGTLNNCTITSNESTTKGGGVWSASGGVVRNCTISDNKSVLGGGIYLYIGGTVLDCIISGNWGTESGGGVFFKWGGTVSNCTITANHLTGGYHGGGVYETVSSGAGGILVKSTISDNSAARHGGGIYCDDLTVRNCVISNNVGEFATSGAGGVYVAAGGAVTIENCEITANASLGNASSGGIAVAPTAANTLIRGCLISGNSGAFGGGVNVEKAVVESCTIVRNQAVYGGGVFGEDSDGYMTNSIVYFNDQFSLNPARGPNVYNNTGAGCELSYCCTTPYPDGTTSTNFTFDPSFVDAGSGSGTNDYVAGDYRLQESSLCINAGTNMSWMTSGVDFDGNDRLYAGGLVDIGAYEFTPSLPGGTVITVK